MLTNFENINDVNVIFLQDFFEKDGKYFVDIVGYIEEVEFHTWLSLRKKREDFNRKIGEVGKWEKTSDKKTERAIRKNENKFYEVSPKLSQSLDNRSLLEKLSGTSHVRFERFTFRRNGNGTEQIFVNNKSTGCWIDSNNKIGSYSKGGPDVTNWLMYYGYSFKESMKIINQL